MLVLGLEHAVDLHDEVLQVEGLGQQLGLGRGAAALERDGGEAGDEHDADAGSIALAFWASSMPSISGMTMSVRSRSNALGLEQRHRLGAAVDGLDVIADPLQRALQIFAHRRIVFGQEDSRHRHNYAPIDCFCQKRMRHSRVAAPHVSPNVGRNLTVTDRSPPPSSIAPRGDLPVLLSVPHSGRDYPEWLVDMAAARQPALATLEDPLVDRLVWRAIQRGAGAVIARAPRAAIDCNRAEHDIDPSVVDGARSGRMSARARGGLGIVPARTQQHGHLWRRAISAVQLERAARPGAPALPRAIDEQLSLLLDRFGCALLLDCHSMPPPPEGVAPVVFGDGRGSTADSWLSREALAIANGCGFRPPSTCLLPADM